MKFKCAICGKSECNDYVIQGNDQEDPLMQYCTVHEDDTPRKFARLGGRTIREELERLIRISR